MRIQDIPKVKAGKFVSVAPLETSENIKSLAQRANDLLGYKVLNGVITGNNIKTSISGPLTETLQSLEIEVLDTNSVIHYQMDEIQERNLNLIKSRLHDWCVGWFSPSAWAHTKLGDYSEPIPEFVINKAIQIKEANPSVEFVIQHLNEPKADPFLVAYLGNEIYYIEVWDEPKFEGF